MYCMVVHRSCSAKSRLVSVVSFLSGSLVADFRGGDDVVTGTLAHYLVEFNEDGTIKDKVYPPGFEVYGSESRPIIHMTKPPFQQMMVFAGHGWI